MVEWTPRYWSGRWGALFAIINPVVMPLLLSLTQGQDASQQRRTALRTTLFSTIVTGLVMVSGAMILRLFGIGVNDFRGAGGLVLLMIALSMLHGKGSSAHEGGEQEKAHHATVDDVAFYPMTVPLIVGPGTIASIIVMQSQAHGLGGHLTVAAALAAVLVMLGVVLYFSAGIGAHLSMTSRPGRVRRRRRARDLRAHVQPLPGRTGPHPGSRAVPHRDLHARVLRGRVCGRGRCGGAVTTIIMPAYH